MAASPTTPDAHPGNGEGRNDGRGERSGTAVTAGQTPADSTAADRTSADRTPPDATAPRSSAFGSMPRKAAVALKRTSHNRASVLHRVRYAMQHPDRVRPYLRRLLRDWKFRRAAGGDHVAYYRSVMRDDTARNPRGAVGTPSEDRWNALGEMQFRYLRGHGLTARQRLLEIGCGNLRAGRHFIDYLDAGNYYGVDISPDILLAAQRTLVDHGLQAKLPNLGLVDDLRLEHLPDGAFDVVHAHSVFSHSPRHVIDECFAHVARILAPGGFFDFTYNRTEGREHQVLHEDFYYRPETLIAMAESHGLTARTMDDWDELPHKQSKIRVTVTGDTTEDAART